MTNSQHHLILTYIGVAFSRAIEFAHLFNIEALSEFLPYLRSETIAENYPHFVLIVSRLWFLGQQISTNLSNILSGLTMKVKSIKN